jgi:hypothetical protein
MSWARMVPVVARAWKMEARVPAARVRLNAIAAQTSQALLAQNLPDGRCASGPFFRSAMTCSTMACAVRRVGVQHRQRVVGEHRVVAVDGERLAVLGRVQVGHSAQRSAAR